MQSQVAYVAILCVLISLALRACYIAGIVVIPEQTIHNTYNVSKACNLGPGSARAANIAFINP